MASKVPCCNNNAASGLLNLVVDFSFSAETEVGAGVRSWVAPESKIRRSGCWTPISAPLAWASARAEAKEHELAGSNLRNFESMETKAGKIFRRDSSRGTTKVAKVPGRSRGVGCLLCNWSSERSPVDPPRVVACRPDVDVDGDVGGDGSRRCCRWLSRWRRP